MSRPSGLNHMSTPSRSAWRAQNAHTVSPTCGRASRMVSRSMSLGPITFAYPVRAARRAWMSLMALLRKLPVTSSSGRPVRSASACAVRE